MTDHGVSEGLYDNLGRQVILVCLCGYEAAGPNWEEAGADLDDHIKNELRAMPIKPPPVRNRRRRRA